MRHFVAVAWDVHSLVVNMSERELQVRGFASARGTIHRDLRKLSSGAEPRLQLLSRGMGTRASRWRVLLPPVVSQSEAMITPPASVDPHGGISRDDDRPGLLDRYPDLWFWGALGATARAVLEDLAESEARSATAAGLAERLGLKPSTVNRTLQRLAEHQVVTRSVRSSAREPYLWALADEAALPDRLARAAEALGVVGKLAQVEARIAAERGVHRGLAGRREREYAPHPALEEALRSAMQWGVGEPGEDGEEGEEGDYFCPQAWIVVVDPETGEVVGTLGPGADAA